MSENLIKNLRIIPREDSFLDRKLGSRGEIFFDRDNNTLRLYDGTTTGGISLAKNNLSNVSNSDFLTKATAAGVGGAGLTSFSTIAVAGQSNVVADTSSDTLTLVAGNNVTLTTNASTDTITIAAQSYTLPTSTTETLGGVKVDGSTIVINDGVISSISGGEIVSGDSFSFSVAADDSTQREISSGETIKFIGTGSVTTSSDEEGNITINANTGSSFETLTDIAVAGMTVDQIYLPAITMLYVTNSGASAYLFDQYSGNNPTIYAISGTTIAFELAAVGHPFLIQDGTGTNYNTGLYHVTTGGTVTTGAAAQGKDSGVLYWKIPIGISGNYRYQCSVHGPMVGAITIKNFVSI